MEKATSTYVRQANVSCWWWNCVVIHNRKKSFLCIGGERRKRNEKSFLIPDNVVCLWSDRSINLRSFCLPLHWRKMKNLLLSFLSEYFHDTVDGHIAKASRKKQPYTLHQELFSLISFTENWINYLHSIAAEWKICIYCFLIRWSSSAFMCFAAWNLFEKSENYLPFTF